MKIHQVFASLLAVLCLAAIASAQPFTTTTILAHGSIADLTEGGQGEVDISLLRGRGAFVMSAMTSAGTTPTLALKLQQSAAAVQGAEYATVGTNDIVLRNNTNDNIKLSAKWTQSGARQIKTASLVLKNNGTITAGKILTLTLETDTAGDPSGTALGTAGTVLCSAVGTSYSYITFTFAKPVDVADATVYHLVLAGDYTVSSSNNITWRTATVASGGNANVYDSAYAAVTTNSREFYLRQYNFADVTGGGFTTVTTTSSTQTRQLDVDGLGEVLRAHATVTGSSTPTYYGGIVLVTSKF